MIDGIWVAFYFEVRMSQRNYMTFLSFIFQYKNFVQKNLPNFAIFAWHGHGASMADRGPVCLPGIYIFPVISFHVPIALSQSFYFPWVLSHSLVSESPICISFFLNLKTYCQCSADEYVNCAVNFQWK